MNIIVSDDAVELGKAAGKKAAILIKDAIATKGQANIILATGASQFETLKQLTAEDVDWSRVVIFHLDEYIGLSENAPASFRRYLKERFLNKVSAVKKAHLINGEGDVHLECRRLGNIINEHFIDVALVGIGENGHLAFNDPPADFDTVEPYLVVDLDEDCRKQQLGEGWFNSIDEVPKQAISMSIRQILKSKYIICSVPDKRKSAAVRDAIETEVSNLRPASILQLHQNCLCFLDRFSASLLSSQNSY